MHNSIADVLHFRAFYLQEVPKYFLIIRLTSDYVQVQEQAASFNLQTKYM